MEFLLLITNLLLLVIVYGIGKLGRQLERWENNERTSSNAMD